MSLNALDFVNIIAQKFIEEEKERPALEYLAPGDLQAEIDLSIPESGGTMEAVMEQLRTVVMHTPRTAGKRFFNQLFGGRIMPATAADMLVALLNNSMYTYKVAGIQVLIEQEVAGKMCELIGYADGEGIFCPGGSLSNLAAMIIARNERQAAIRNQGLDGARYTAYTSDQSHYSIRKNAGIIGVGRDNVRQIQSDDAGKMDTADLRRRIKEDLQNGCRPFFINATAGTTVLGAFDPIEEIHEIAREFGIWLHVDGVWGGTMLLSRRHKGLLRGCEHSDSFAWNAHKMMGAPLTASAILTRQRGLLEKHFSERADYLFQSEDDRYNPGARSIQCGRRNDALKVWAAWQYYGMQGYEERVNRQYRLAEYAADKVINDRALQLCLKPESLNVCFQVKGKSSEKICDLLDREGIIKVGYGNFRGQSYIRLVCVNAELSFQDIDYFFEQVKAAGERI